MQLITLDSRGAGGARATPEFGGSEKGRSLISADRLSYYYEHPWILKAIYDAAIGSLILKKKIMLLEKEFQLTVYLPVALLTWFIQ